MPIGFAKSILTTSAAAGAGAEHYGWTTSGEVDSGNMASYKFTGVDMDSTVDFSLVMWFRVNGTSWIDSQSTIIHFPHDNYPSTNERIRLFYTTGNTFRWQALTGNNSYITTVNYDDGSGAGHASISNSFFDGSWHCLMANLPGGGGGQFYIDGISMGTRNLTTAAIATTNYEAGMFRYAPTSQGGDYNASEEVGSDFQIGPTWFYGDAIDFSSSTVRGYYYNAGNTDGYVETGTDGTSGGATQPQLFFYHNGTTLLNGGTDTVTISETSIGTGSIVTASDGPGSGGTTS